LKTEINNSVLYYGDRERERERKETGHYVYAFVS
jgi:hypothetical protein